MMEFIITTTIVNDSQLLLQSFYVLIIILCGFMNLSAGVFKVRHQRKNLEGRQVIKKAVESIYESIQVKVINCPTDVSFPISF